jgi:hypothetical protein
MQRDIDRPTLEFRAPHHEGSGRTEPCKNVPRCIVPIWEMSTILDDLVDLWVRGAAEAAFVDDGNLGDLGGLLALHSGRIPSSPAAVFDDHDLVEATHAPLPVLAREAAQFA